MTRQEVVKLCAFIEAACPSQQMDELTPLVWHTILPAAFTLDECCEAAAVIIRRGGRFVDLGGVIEQVRLARRPAVEAERLRVLLDPVASRAQIEADDAATDAALARIAARAGRPGARLRAVPPPDYEGTG